MSFPRPYGRYILDERIAMGGMAEIFRARTSTEGFEKRVCIKRILPHYLESPDFVTMFRDEAALAARLQHANVVQVFDFGEAEGTLYLAMELVDGTDLRKLASLVEQSGGRWSIGHAVQVAIEMCRGLYHAHTLTDDGGKPLDIVHRDISPHNVLISRAGEVKITDFGIAKAAARATHTGTGVVKGKLAYMAPEQALGEQIDHRLDQFATGIVLWELLTQRRLFGGQEEVSVLRKVMTCEVDPVRKHRPDVPEALESIVMRSLAMKPGDRHDDMRAFERALTRFLFSFTDDPGETDLRALVGRMLDEPSAPSRKTAVMREVAAAAKASAPTAPEERAATTDPEPSQVFASFGESQQSSLTDSLADHIAAPSAATALIAGGAAGKSAAPPIAEDSTARTRTLVPDAERLAADTVSETSKGPPQAAAEAQAIAPPDATRLGRAEPPRRPPLALFAAGAGIAIIGALLGGLLAMRGKGEEASAAGGEPVVSRAVERGEPAEPESVPSAAPPAPAATAPVAPPASGEARPEAPPVAPARRAEPRAEAKAEAKERAKGKVYVEMSRGWANVYLGARHLCETPCTVEVPAGAQTLRLVLPDGAEVRQRVSVKANQLVRALVPAP